MRRRAKCKWWLDFSTKWYSKKPYTPFSQSYELGCFSSMFVVVVACWSVCLFVWLFECFYVWLACWLVDLFVEIVCLFVCLIDCFVCLFALQWGRFHHPFCNFCKSQITVQNLDFVGSLLDGGIGVWIELFVCRNLLFCSILVHIFSPSILWALGMLIAVPER